MSLMPLMQALRASVWDVFVVWSLQTAIKISSGVDSTRDAFRAGRLYEARANLKALPGASSRQTRRGSFLKRLLSFPEQSPDEQVQYEPLVTVRKWNPEVDALYEDADADTDAGTDAGTDTGTDVDALNTLVDVEL